MYLDRAAEESLASGSRHEMIYGCPIELRNGGF